jgi:hypothetical protein
MGFHAFHKPDFPPSQIRLCVAGFMTRFVATTAEDGIPLLIATLDDIVVVSGAALLNDEVHTEHEQFCG